MHPRLENALTRRTGGLLLVALGLVLFAPPTAQAVPIIRVQTVLAPQGSSGFFDVFLDIPAGSPAISLATFTLDLSTPAAQGVQFTGVQTSEQAGQPYAFPGGTGFVANGFQPFSSNIFPNTSFLATDSSTLLAGQPEGPGPFSTGLARVSFSVAANATVGPHALTLGPLTGLANADGGTIEFQGQNGFITVTPQQETAIPEPSSLLLFAAAALAGAWYRRRGRGAAAA